MLDSLADRIYASTWRWLEEPGERVPRDVLALLDEFPWLECGGRLSQASAQRLTNAILWLGFFDPTADAKVKEIVDYLHPSSGTLYPPMRLLRAKPARRERFTIDLETFQILDRKLPEGTRVLPNEPACRALELLRATPHVTREVFARECFGFRRYDSEIHNPRVFSLLGRLRRQLDGTIDLFVRSGVVFAAGSWTQFYFRQPPRRSLVGAHLPRLSEAAPSGPEWRGSLSRSNLERRLRIARSTVNRRLTDWIASGRVVREGSGRGTLYRVV